MTEPKEYDIEIDVQGVQQLTQADEDFLFIDCREQNEFDLCRIDGAKLMPMGAIPESLGELEPFREKRIVIHCHHGGRSLRVANWLRQQGFSGSQSMAGGIDDWSQKIDPEVPRY